jgi:hypothetical protein
MEEAVGGWMQPRASAHYGVCAVNGDDVAWLASEPELAGFPASHIKSTLSLATWKE